MPLTFATPPDGSLTVLQEGLEAVRAARLAGAEGGQAMAPLATASVMRPHPVYALGLHELAAGKGIKAARLAAWRYLLVANNQITEAAELYPDARGRGCKFGAVTNGFVAGEEQALSLVDQLPDIQKGDYEIRALQILALYVRALWLKDNRGNSDRLIVIPPAFPPVQALQPCSMTEFLNLLRPLAEEKLKLEWNDTPDYYRKRSVRAASASSEKKNGKGGAKKKGKEPTR